MKTPEQTIAEFENNQAELERLGIPAMEDIGASDAQISYKGYPAVLRATFEEPVQMCRWPTTSALH